MRILVIEDSSVDYYLLVRQLRKIGNISISPQVDTLKAFENALKSENYDLILADYNVPNLEPPVVLEILSKQSLNIPLIIISGAISPRLANSVLNCGAVDWICKDDFSGIAARIKQLAN